MNTNILSEAQTKVTGNVYVIEMTAAELAILRNGLNFTRAAAERTLQSTGEMYGFSSKAYDAAWIAYSAHVETCDKVQVLYNEALWAGAYETD